MSPRMEIEVDSSHCSSRMNCPSLQHDTIAVPLERFQFRMRVVRTVASERKQRRGILVLTVGILVRIDLNVGSFPPLHNRSVGNSSMHLYTTTYGVSTKENLLPRALGRAPALLVFMLKGFRRWLRIAFSGLWEDGLRGFNDAMAWCKTNCRRTRV